MIFLHYKEWKIFKKFNLVNIQQGNNLCMLKMLTMKMLVKEEFD